MSANEYQGRAFLTIEEAADVLRLHPRTVFRMCSRGDLVAFKTSRGGAGHWRIRVDGEGMPRVPPMEKLSA